ncbi:hypothetical protein EKK58_04685 [Candidatus Dependentiae bacterium]|nr:MAG: hypothetical protein EKK58_04685 [Candidatus Dependentiae bacterium]
MKKQLYIIASCLHLLAYGYILDPKNHILDTLYSELKIEQPVTFIPVKMPNIYEIVINGTSYIVRLNEEYNRFARVIECNLHTYAAEKGFGPQIFYHNPDKHIIIMEKLQAKELVPADIEACLPKLVEALHAMHNSPIESRHIHTFTTNTIKKIYNLDQHANPRQLNTFAIYGHLLRLEKLFEDDYKVMIHQDLHPFNIFFDGVNFKFIDFETPHLDTPFVDLAHVALFYCMNEEQEKKLLSLYFNREITVLDYIKLKAMKCFVCTKFICWMLNSLPTSTKDSHHSIDLSVLEYTPPLNIFLKCAVTNIKNAKWRYRLAISAIKTFEELIEQIDTYLLKNIVNTNF